MNKNIKILTNFLTFFNKKYVLDLLSEIEKLGCKQMETLIEQNHKLCEAPEDTMVNRESYQRLVGRLIFSYI